MNNVPIEKVRNIVVVGHASSGKTTLVEALLHTAGMTKRFGSVIDKNTVSDCSTEEQERQVSIHSSNLFIKYRDHDIFIADTPGYADFFGQVVANVSVADSAILVVDASHGIEVGARRAWKLLRKKNIPTMIAINKLDKEGVRFREILAELVEVFGKNCIPVEVPYGLSADFTGVSELIEDPTPETNMDFYEEYRLKMVEAVAESDEVLLEKYFADEEITQAELTKALHVGTANSTIFPVCCCSAVSEVGFKKMLHVIVDDMPSPIDHGEIEVEEGDTLLPDPTLPAAAHVFRTITDPFVGQLTFARVYQGTFSAGTEVMNVTRGQKERIGDLMIIQGKEQISVDKATPGDVIAIAKLKNTHVNDTLGQAKVKFVPVEFPKPVMTLAITNAKQGDEEKLAEGLARIGEEDHTVLVERHPETHEQLISGLGDVHLDVIFKWLKDRYKVVVKTSTPKISYHETIRGTADVRYRHKKQSGGSGQFGEVAIKIRPNVRDGGYEFENKIVGGVISSAFIPSVDKGVRACLTEGVVSGGRVVDIIVQLYDGKEHPVDSKDIAFQIAGKHAFSEGIQKANPVLLEPIMDVHVTCPQEFLGDVNGIINSKRGHITGMDIDGSMQLLNAQVPKSEMFRFCSELRSITGGRGSFSMEFSHYNELPPNVAQTVIAAFEASKAKAEG